MLTKKDVEKSLIKLIQSIDIDYSELDSFYKGSNNYDDTDDWNESDAFEYKFQEFLKKGYDFFDLDIDTEEESETIEKYYNELIEEYKKIYTFYTSKAEVERIKESWNELFNNNPFKISEV